MGDEKTYDVQALRGQIESEVWEARKRVEAALSAEIVELRAQIDAAPAPVREIARRILGPLLPEGVIAGDVRSLSFDEEIDCDRIADLVRKEAQGADRAAFLADVWQRWTAAREADPDAHHSRRGRSHVTSIGDFSATLQVWRSTAREEQFLQEAKRRAVAVVYSRELLMPAWAMAAILAAAPPDARLAQIHQEWTTLDNVLVIHSALFSEVPEGVCPPRLSACWDMVRQVVSVDWPIRPDHFEAKGES